MARPGKKMGYIKPHEIQKRIHNEYDDKVQLGYDKVKIRRKEGERWFDDNGKQWEMREGIARSIPRFTDIRVPLFCPKCNRVMGKKSKDSEIYYKFGFCLDCLIERDAELIRDGQMDEFAKKYVGSKKRGYYEEMKLQVEDYLNSLEKGYIEYPTEEGKLERWSGDMKKLKEFWTKELEFINKELEKIE